MGSVKASDQEAAETMLALKYGSIRAAAQTYYWAFGDAAETARFEDWEIATIKRWILRDGDKKSNKVI
jgi:hypothetical protein